MMKKVVLAILFLCLLALSCKKDPMNLEEIDSDIVIRMWEKLDPKDRSLLFYCSTEKCYPFGNYGISYSMSKSFKRLKIRFDGIIVPDGGPTSVEPAQITIDMGTLSNGRYNLTIDVDGKISTGQLIVSSTRYEIELDKQTQLQLDNSPLNRVPENTIWGSVIYGNDSLKPAALAFLDSLKMMGAQSATWRPGDYGYFTIGSTGQILPPPMPGSPFYMPFIFHYSGDIAALMSFMKEYGKAHIPYFLIMIYTSCGNEQGSWWP